MKKSCLHNWLEVVAVIAMFVGLFGSVLGLIPDWIGIILVLPAIIIVGFEHFSKRR